MTTRDEIDAFNAAYSAALERQDLDAITDMHTDDARLLFPGAPIIRGREAIAASFREDFEGGPVHLRFESMEQLEDGRLVVDIGRYVSARGEGKYAVVLERQRDGSLKIAVDAASADTPRPGG